MSAAVFPGVFCYCSRGPHWECMLKQKPTSKCLIIRLCEFTRNSSTVRSLHYQRFHDEYLSTRWTRSHSAVNESSCDHRRGNGAAGELPPLSGNMWSHHVTKLGIEPTEPQSLVNMCRPFLSLHCCQQLWPFEGTLAKPSCGGGELSQGCDVEKMLSWARQGD